MCHAIEVTAAVLAALLLGVRQPLSVRVPVIMDALKPWSPSRTTSTGLGRLPECCGSWPRPSTTTNVTPAPMPPSPMNCATSPSASRMLAARRSAPSLRSRRASNDGERARSWPIGVLADDEAGEGPGSHRAFHFSPLAHVPHPF
jgi:hypothetical protein